MASIKIRRAEKLRQEWQAKWLDDTLSKWEPQSQRFSNWTQMEEKKLDEEDIQMFSQWSEDMQVVRVVLSRWERALNNFSRREMGFSQKEEKYLEELVGSAKTKLKKFEIVEKEVQKTLTTLAKSELHRLAEELKEMEAEEEEAEGVMYESGEDLQMHDPELIEKKERLAFQEKRLRKELERLPQLVEGIRLEQEWRAWERLAILQTREPETEEDESSDEDEDSEEELRSTRPRVARPYPDVEPPPPVISVETTVKRFKKFSDRCLIM